MRPILAQHVISTKIDLAIRNILHTMVGFSFTARRIPTMIIVFELSCQTIT